MAITDAARRRRPNRRESGCDTDSQEFSQREPYSTSSTRKSSWHGSISPSPVFAPSPDDTADWRTHAFPVDLDRVSQRLLERPDRIERPRRSTDESLPTPPLLDLNVVDEVARQIGLNYLLVQDGGRAPFPVSEIMQVMEDPGQYADILSYWDSDGLHWKAQGHHLVDWIQFREAQRQGRKQGAFSRHDSQVRAILSRHNFDKQIQLTEDPSQQDPLSTWAEYLALKYRAYDRHQRAYQRKQQHFDREWKKLQGAGIVPASDTPDDFNGKRIAAAQEQKVRKARTALQSAEAKLQSAKAAHDSEERILELQARIVQLQQTLDAAKKGSSMMTAFLDATSGYWGLQKESQRQEKFLKWMLQQVPIIEQEMEDAEGRSKRSPEEPYRNPVWPESNTIFSPSGHSPWAYAYINEDITFMERRLRGEDVPTQEGKTNDDDNGDFGHGAGRAYDAPGPPTPSTNAILGPAAGGSMFRAAGSPPPNNGTTHISRRLSSGTAIDGWTHVTEYPPESCDHQRALPPRAVGGLRRWLRWPG